MLVVPQTKGTTMSHPNPTATSTAPRSAERPNLAMVFAIHGALTRDADLMVACIADLQPQDRVGRIPALCTYFAKFATQLENHHHHEDVVFFPALSAKVGAGAMAFDVLDAQHHALDGAIATLTSALQTLGDPRTGFVCAQQAALEAAQALRTRIGEHLTIEEGVAFPLYLDAISVTEHAELEARVQAMGTFEDLTFMIPWLFDTIPAPVTRRGGRRAARVPTGRVRRSSSGLSQPQPVPDGARP